MTLAARKTTEVVWQKLTCSKKELRLDVTLMSGQSFRWAIMKDNNNYKTSIGIAAISSKKSSSVAHLVEGLGKLIIIIWNKHNNGCEWFRPSTSRRLGSSLHILHNTGIGLQCISATYKLSIERCRTRSMFPLHSKPFWTSNWQIIAMIMMIEWQQR